MATTPFRYDYVIDGSNVLLENKVDKKASVRLFAALLSMLDQKGLTYRVWFDESIFRHLAEKGGDEPAFKRLLENLQRRSSVMRCAEIPGQAHGGVHDDSPPSVDDVADPVHRNPERARQFVEADLDFPEFVSEHSFSGPRMMVAELSGLRP